MRFDEAHEYLLTLLGERASAREVSRLDRFRALVHELGSPQHRYPTIHVAGTSGKGSTATMIAGAMRASGKRVGLHTKPHLHSITERIRIDGAELAEQRFGELLESMMPAIERIAPLHGRPTYYEVLLALAFVAFADSNVDIAVIEAGVGGRLDGTNVLFPNVSVITNVSFDHMDILGSTIAEIARDKAGIAKSGVPLVSDAQGVEARREIENACKSVGAPFISVADSVSIELRSCNSEQRIAVITPVDRYELNLNVLGPFQHRNAATAIRALEQLDDGLRPERSAIERGVAQIEMPGRMEVVGASPTVVFDIAHNPDKAAHLVDGLLTAFSNSRFIVLLAVGKTKDVPGILSELRVLSATFVFTSFSVDARDSFDAPALAKVAHEMGIDGQAIGDPIEAFERAKGLARGDDVILITGSTFIVAALRMFAIHTQSRR